MLHGLLQTVDGQFEHGENLADHVKPFAHDIPNQDFLEAIRNHQPDILIGATGTPATFTEEIVRLMATIKSRPGIFALSNPTARAECTAEEAYRWTEGRGIFASGSPFFQFLLTEKPIGRARATIPISFPELVWG